MTTSAKSLPYLREHGYLAQKVEQWNNFAHRRIDLYGCIDIVAIKDGEQGVLGVQATNMNEIDVHIDKAQNDCGVALKVWLKAGNKFEIHGWKGKEVEIVKLVIKNDLIMRGD